MVVVKRSLSHSLSWQVDHQEEDQVVLVAEEVADGGGRGGGGWMTWPPRSYSCSFCKREFRSAQALGGHMNVHRRDRALLNQVVSNNIIDHHDQPFPSPPSDRHHHLKSSSKYPSHIIHPRATVPKHYLSPARVSSGVKKIISTNDAAQLKMSMGLDFSKGRYRDDKQEKDLSSKRFKRNYDNGVSLFPFFDDCSNVKGNPNLHATNKSMEGLDLELRLGLVNHLLR